MFVYRITTILFAPMNPHVTKVMEETAKKLKLKAEGAKNAESMQVLMQDEDNLKTYLGGVQFDDLLNGDNSSSLPKDLSVTIRFPAELRYKPSKENLTAPDSWGTNLLFPIFSFAGPRSPNSSFTAPPRKNPIFVKDHAKGIFFRLLRRRFSGSSNCSLTVHT